MRMSDAMREGAERRPQAVGQYFQNMPPYGSCGLGAIYEGLTGEFGVFCVDEMFQTFPQLLRPTRCPACNFGEMQLSSVISELNDVHHWSRERIAGWLDEFELAEAKIREVSEPQLHEASRS